MDIPKAQKILLHNILQQYSQEKALDYSETVISVISAIRLVAANRCENREVARAAVVERGRLCGVDYTDLEQSFKDTMKDIVGELNRISLDNRYNFLDNLVYVWNNKTYYTGIEKTNKAKAVKRVFLPTRSTLGWDKRNADNTWVMNEQKRIGENL